MTHNPKYYKSVSLSISNLKFDRISFNASIFLQLHIRFYFTQLHNDWKNTVVLSTIKSDYSIKIYFFDIYRKDITNQMMSRIIF